MRLRRHEGTKTQRHKGTKAQRGTRPIRLSWRSLVSLSLCPFVLVLNSAASSTATRAESSPRQMEKLGRGVVAVNQGDGNVFVGWRLLGTDPDAIAFNLYRITDSGKAVKLNGPPIANATSFIDSKADLTKSNAYFVRPLLNRREQDPSAQFQLGPNSSVRQYISIPLQTPRGYTPNDASVGDLDGDGEYEIVLHQAGRGRDNSDRKSVV